MLRLILALLLTAPACALAESKAFAAGVLIDRDVQYVPGGDVGQRLDIYTPATPPAHPLPLIIYLHGGGWIAGSKTWVPAPMIVGAGYILASVEYRFSTAAKFPAQIQDCQAAVRWLRANAAKYHIDGDQIGVYGESAGGHLAALLGTAGNSDAFKPIGPYPTESANVQAVCDNYGPSDFTTYIDQVKADKTVQNVFRPGTGSTDLYRLLTGNSMGADPKMDRLASPITYVDAADPPFLIVHGKKDNLVPVAQSVELADAINKAGGSAVLQLLDDAGHGGPQFWDPRVIAITKNFFDRHLKGMDVKVEANPELGGR